MATKQQEKVRAARAGKEYIDDTLGTVGQTPETQHYVKNSVLLEEIIRCKKENNGQASEALAAMFLQIATKLSNKLVFPSQEDREDVIFTAVHDCLKYFSNFDENITKNAFAYITSICTNGFAKAWRQLGYMKLPNADRVYLSDNIYSI